MMDARAKDAVTANTCTLSNALQSDRDIFLKTVQKFVERRIITTETMNTLLDTYTGQTLAERAGKLVDSLQRRVSVEPNALDDILCILHESESLLIQEAAKKIEKDCK